MPEIKVGQVWEKRNGRRVVIEAAAHAGSNGFIGVRGLPGRRSWPRASTLLREYRLIEESRPERGEEKENDA